jgi:hypothetical protein
MKKLFILTAFLGLGYVGVQAQTVAPSKPAQQAPKTVAPATTNTKVEVTDATEAAAVTPTKKECSTETQKSCTPAKSSKKGACCSKKATTKPAQ